MPQRHGLVITPVYRQISEDAIDHEGTAVLVGVNTRWLFTAAHVVAGHASVFLPGRPQVQIRRERFGLSPLSLDLAYAELSPNEIKTLIACGLKFLPLENLAASTEMFPPSRNGCVITGFPVGSVEIDGNDRTIQVKPTMVISQFLTHGELVQSRLDAQNQVAAKFGGLTAGIFKLKKYDPRGMSGGAIWNTCVGNAKLVGIATDYDPTRKIVIGTRIRPMLEEIVRGLREADSGSAQAPAPS